VVVVEPFHVRDREGGDPASSDHSIKAIDSYNISYLSNDFQKPKLFPSRLAHRQELIMDIDRVLSQLLSHPARAGIAGAVAGGLLSSKSGRKLGKKALELGGMAALAGLAYTAWQRHRAGAADVAPSQERLRSAGFLPATAAAGEDLGRSLLRAMIAAARADGRLDVRERSALLEQIGRLELDEAERAELYAEIERPVSIEEVVASAKTPAQAVELYTASLAVTGADAPAERGYLSLLAARLRLDDALVASVHRELGLPPDAGAPPAPRAAVVQAIATSMATAGNSGRT
jgi:uncharacterized membrane protein YebE (DUF533 family)